MDCNSGNASFGNCTDPFKAFSTQDRTSCKYSNANALININDNVNSFHYVLPVHSNDNNRHVLSNVFLKMTLYQNWRW